MSDDFDDPPDFTIPWFEYNWEQDENSKWEWVPLFVQRPRPPGVREPVRYMEIPCLFTHGKILVEGEWVDPPMNVSPRVMHPANRERPKQD